MSNLRLTSISNQGGTASVPSASVPSDTVINGTAKAWVNFNGNNTISIRAAFNVSSITDNGTGDYTINFTNAMPDANYAVSWNSGMKSIVWGLPLFGGLSGWGTDNSHSTTQVRVLAVTPADNPTDNPQCNVVVFR